MFFTGLITALGLLAGCGGGGGSDTTSTAASTATSTAAGCGRWRWRRCGDAGGLRRPASGHRRLDRTGHRWSPPQRRLPVHPSVDVAVDQARRRSRTARPRWLPVVGCPRLGHFRGNTASGDGQRRRPAPLQRAGRHRGCRALPQDQRNRSQPGFTETGWIVLPNGNVCGSTNTITSGGGFQSRRHPPAREGSKVTNFANPFPF